MKTKAKVKYFVLRIISTVETWYKNLTNVVIMKLGIFALLVMFFTMCFVASFSNIKNYKKDVYIKNLEKQIVELQKETTEKNEAISLYKKREKTVKRFVREMFSRRYYRISLTGYHPVPEQTDSTPDITADGTKFDIKHAGEYRYVALSRDLLSYFNKRGAEIHFGDYVLIKGTPEGKQDGIYQVRDTMNKRHTEWIDILLSPGEKSFYYRDILMSRIEKPEFISILNEVYNSQGRPQPLAKLEPEI